MSYRLARLALALQLLVVPAAVAAPLLRATDAARPGALPSERALAVDHDALASLRGRSAASLESFPLGADGTVTLDLVRIHPFGPKTRLVDMTDAGPRAIALPDETYFSGTVRC